MKKTLIFIAKIIIIFAIFRFIISKFDISKSKLKFEDISFTPLIYAFIIAICARFVTTLKWHLLLKYHGIKETYLKVLKIVFESQFLGLMLPTNFGVDAIRFYKIQKQQKKFSATAGSILVDRIFAVLAMSFLTVIASFSILSLIEEKPIILSIMILSILLICFIIFLISSLPSSILEFISKHLSYLHSEKQSKKWHNIIINFAKRTKDKILEIHKNFQGLKKHPEIIFNLIILNIIVQLSRIFEIHFLFRALNVHVSIFAEMAFIPIIILVTLLPISFFGLGFKEGTFIFFFSLVSIPNEVSFSVSLLSYPLLLAGIIPGAILFLIDKSTKPSSQEATI